MAIRRIRHIGVVTADLGEALEVWHRRIGLPLAPENPAWPRWDAVEAVSLAIGESRIELGRPTSPSSEAGRYLEAWGPGIHHLCLYSDDLEGDLARMGSAGVGAVALHRAGRARVALVPPEANLGVALALWQEEGDPTPARGGTPLFTYLHHFGWALPWSLRDPFLRLVEAYGLQVDQARTPLPDGRYVESDNVRNIDVLVGESRLEANFPLDDVSGTARYLARRGGPAPHHVCLYTPDMESAVAHLASRGLRQIGSLEPVRPGDEVRVAFFHPRSVGGVLLELWQDL